MILQFRKYALNFVNLFFYFSINLLTLFLPPSFQLNCSGVAETGEAGVSKPDRLQSLDRYVCEVLGAESAPPW